MDFLTNNLQIIIEFLIITILYFFFCRFSFTLIKQLNILRQNANSSGRSIKEQFETEYNRNVKEPYSEYSDRNIHLNPQRTYYKIWTSVSLLLVCFNSFILAEFLNNIGNLSKAILLDPVRLNYSHLLAAVIVIVEIFTGAGYYIFHKNQKENQDDTIWGMMKWLTLMTFLCLLFVETVMWMKLSINFDMSEELLLSSGNVFITLIDYFLAALGIGFTFFEFFAGYLTSYYKGFAGESHFLHLGRNIIYTSGLIIILFIPSVLLVILQGLIAIISELIKLITMPGNFIYENIFKKKTSAI